MATLDLPAWGYGIRYTYGIFKQLIRHGAQVEQPDFWLTFGNPWEVRSWGAESGDGVVENAVCCSPCTRTRARARTLANLLVSPTPPTPTTQIERVDVSYPIRFYGHTRKEPGVGGAPERTVWEGGEIVMAVAYDNPVPGFDTFNTINLRLFRAAPAREFDLASFNSGNYMQAVEQRQRAETISNVLYPSDNTYSGKELRLKQQYFFVAATLQDVVRRFKRIPGWVRAGAEVGVGVGNGTCARP